MHILRLLLYYGFRKEKRIYQGSVQGNCRKKNYLEGEVIDTVYFGGGTPSQLEKDDFTNIFRTIYDNYSVNPYAEITIEANPDDLTDGYVKMLSTLPFNRLSMGIQTFNDDILSLLKRRHNAQQAIEAFGKCKMQDFAI